jgi:HSP20 family protein
VTIDKGLLTIAGERKTATLAASDAKLNVYARERASGRFRRVVTLPEDADPERVEASYRDGVVRVRVQKREASRPRRIEIRDAQ